VESLVILSPAKEWWAKNVETNLNTSGSDGCRARSRSSTSLTDERYNAKIDSMQITSKAQMVPHW
jgi:hypothetical protein